MRSPRQCLCVAGALLGLVALPIAALAQADDEGPGLIGLSLPLGARVIGQGRAVAATTGEIQALPYNPAAIEGLGRGALTFSRFEAAAVTDVSGNYLAGGVTTRWGTIAIHAVYIDYGDIPVTEASPEPVGSIEVSDWAVGVTYAGRTWGDKLAYGATAKWLSTGFGSLEAGGPAFDGGLVYSPRPELPLSLAVSLRNMGPDLDFDEDGASGETSEQALPARVRVGVNVHPETFFGLPEDYSVELGFDIESDLHELATSSQHAGGALTIGDIVVVRGGFSLLDNPFATGSADNRNIGGAIGAGIRFRGFEADVAREISVSELGDEMHFAVGWRF